MAVVRKHGAFTVLAVRRSREPQECLYATRNDTAQDASAGYAQRYWARMTAYFQHRVWCLVLPLHMRPTATYWSRGSPALWLGLCRWLLVSMCLSNHRQILNRPTSRLSARNSKQTTRASARN